MPMAHKPGTNKTSTSSRAMIVDETARPAGSTHDSSSKSESRPARKSTIDESGGTKNFRAGEMKGGEGIGAAEGEIKSKEERRSPNHHPRACTRCGTDSMRLSSPADDRTSSQVPQEVQDRVHSSALCGVAQRHRTDLSFDHN